MFAKLGSKVSVFGGHHNVIVKSRYSEVITTSYFLTSHIHYYKQRARVVWSESDTVRDNKFSRTMPLLCYPLVLNSNKMVVIISSTIRCDENN